MKDSIRKVCNVISQNKLQESLLESLSKDTKVFSFANQMEEQREFFESFNQFFNIETSVDKENDVQNS